MGDNVQGGSMILGTQYPYVSAGYYGEVYLQDTQYMGYMQLATCWKDADPCSKGLQCKITDASGTDRIGMSLQVPTWDYYDEWDMMGMGGYTSNSFRPAWGVVTDNPHYTWIPIAFTYEDAPCPCY